MNKNPLKKMYINFKKLKEKILIQIRIYTDKKRRQISVNLLVWKLKHHRKNVF